MYKVEINQATLDQIEIGADGKCLKCPWLRTRMGKPWCKLIDFFDPEFRECELYQQKLFKGVRRK